MLTSRPPSHHPFLGQPRSQKNQEGRGLSWATRLFCKGGVGGVALSCGLQSSGSGPGCAGCAGGGEACNLVPRYPRTPVSAPSSSTPSGAQCQVAWTSRRWPEAGPLYRDQAPSAAARRHPASCRLLQPTPDPSTGGEVLGCGLAGRAWQVRTHATRCWSVRFACGGLGRGSSCLVRISFICFHG